MNLIDSIHSFDLEVTTILALVTLGYTSYYFIAFSKHQKIILSRKSHSYHTDDTLFLFQKITGFTFLGFLPFLLAYLLLKQTYFHFELSALFQSQTILSLIFASLIILPMNFLFARKPSNLLRFPQIRSHDWTKKTIFIAAAGWALYLFAYEYLFRGILFFGLLPHIGLVATIAINTSIYALVHIPNGAKETIGAIPLGIVVCLLTFETGSIWPAFLIHLTLAWSNEFFALYYHPEMHLRNNP